MLFDSLLERVGGGEGGIENNKIGRPGQGGRNILDLDGQGGWGVLKIKQFSWTSYVYRPYCRSVSNEISLDLKVCFSLVT